MDKREINDRYAEIGMNLVKTDSALEYIKNSQATIIYLSSDHKKSHDGKKIFAQCEKVPEKYKWSVPCDFTITVFEPNIEGFSDEQIKILLLHELLHVGIALNEDGSETYSCVSHDLEDFKLIIDRYGTDWATVD